MKLILDWSEDLIDIVAIAVAAHACDMSDELERMQQMHTHSPADCGDRCVLNMTQGVIDELHQALKDLTAAAAGEEDDEDGIYPVKELLGSHESRLLKEEPS